MCGSAGGLQQSTGLRGLLATDSSFSSSKNLCTLLLTRFQNPSSLRVSMANPLSRSDWFSQNAQKGPNVLSGTGRSFQTIGYGYAADSGYIRNHGIDAQYERNGNRGKDKGTHSK